MTWLATADGEIVRLKEDARISRQESTAPEVLIVTSAADRERLAGEVHPGVTARLIEAERESYQSGAGQEGVYLTAPGPHRTKPEGFFRSCWP